MNTVARYGAVLALVGAVGTGAGLAVHSMSQKEGAASASAIAPAPTSPADAVRLAKQATFGPNQATVDRIVAVGAEAWIDEQMALTDSTYTDLTTGKYAQPNCDSASDVHLCIQTYFRAQPVAMRFYSNALSKPDQLRQRVAFALSQMIVTSGMKVEQTAGVASFQQIMLNNAFGNYKTIIREVTLSPAMGDYLDMATSIKGTPNQNYAREMMQIFAIYPSTLNPDGTLVVNGQGQTTPTYTEHDVNEVARALTGWTYNRWGSGAVWHERKPSYNVPMVQYPASYKGEKFDAGEKNFLGTTIRAGATPEENVTKVVDTVFAQPNVGPYISKQLIQHLVTSNPSPAYVARVTDVFERGGSGRGDLKAVVKAILLDPEARGADKTDANYGKVKEPALYITSFLRVMNATSDGFFAYSKAHDLNQRVFEAPSVFNFYPWDFPLAQSPGLVSPSSKLMGGALDHERHNFMFNYTILDEILGTGRDYSPIPSLGSKTGTKVDWKQWENMPKVEDQVAKMNLLLLNNTMTEPERGALIKAMNAVTDGNAKVQARKRAQTGLYIILTSPQFQVDR